MLRLFLTAGILSFTGLYEAKFYSQTFRKLFILLRDLNKPTTLVFFPRKNQFFIRLEIVFF
jgi:hypothetical protein